MRKLKPIFWLCILFLASVLLAACASQQVQSRKTVEYFQLKAAKIEPELITAEGSTVTIEYEEIIPFEGKELKLSVQTKGSVSEEKRAKYSTERWELSGSTKITSYVGEDVIIPRGYSWKKYKMSNGKIEFHITNEGNLSGEQSIIVFLAYQMTRVSNSVTIKGIFKE